MRTQSGVTLIETAIASLILVAGLAGLAASFAHSIRSSIRVQQQTTALALLSTKMEELKTEVRLTPGRYSELITDSGTFLLTWEISSETPKRVMVSISRKLSGMDNPLEEMGRVSTLVGPGF